jgi:hypothetical protein
VSRLRNLVGFWRVNLKGEVFFVTALDNKFEPLSGALKAIKLLY